MNNPLARSLVVAVATFASGFLGFACHLALSPAALNDAKPMVGSVAVASALLLILKLSAPYDGAFRLSPSGFDQGLAAIGARVESEPQICDVGTVASRRRMGV